MKAVWSTANSPSRINHGLKIVQPLRRVVACRHCMVREVCLPHGLELEALERLEGMILRPAHLKPGDHLYRPADKLRALYAVKSGSVKVYTPMADGDEQIVGFHLPGELIGLDGLGTDTHTCAAAALETTAICELPVAALYEMCHTHPAIRSQLNRLMGSQLAHVREMLLLVGRKSAEGRLAGFLLNLSGRLKARGLSPNQFYLSMSRLDIANYLGLAVETVSRVFSRFQEEGLLTVQVRHVCIHELDRLRTLASTGLIGPLRPRHRYGIMAFTAGAAMRS